MPALNRWAAAAFVAGLALSAAQTARAAGNEATIIDESPARVIGGCILHPIRCSGNLLKATFSFGSGPPPPPSPPPPPPIVYQPPPEPPSSPAVPADGHAPAPAETPGPALPVPT